MEGMKMHVNWKIKMGLGSQHNILDWRIVASKKNNLKNGSDENTYGLITDMMKCMQK